MTHCDDCVTFHTDAVLKAGATQEEILEMLGITVLMSEGSALTDATQVMEAVEALQQSEQCWGLLSTTERSFISSSLVMSLNRPGSANDFVWVDQS